MPVRGTGDSELARLAARQHGVVSRAQLEAAGLARHAITRRVETGRLRRIQHNVYLVARTTLEPFGAETAAVLSCDGHGVLSHRSAAALWGVVDGPPHAVSLTVVGRNVRSRPGLKAHRATELQPADVRIRHCLPLTAPARTLIDLAADASAPELERALAELRVQRLITPPELERALDRAQRRAGVARVRALLAAEGADAPTQSEFERRFRALIRHAELPQPLTNARLLDFKVDFLWPQQRLVVETDGHRFHGHPLAFERDRRRDQILLAAGYRVMRITWRQLTEEPLAVVARLALALQEAA